MLLSALRTNAAHTCSRSEASARHHGCRLSRVARGNNCLLRRPTSPILHLLTYSTKISTTTPKLLSRNLSPKSHWPRKIPSGDGSLGHNNAAKMRVKQSRPTVPECAVAGHLSSSGLCHFLVTRFLLGHSGCCWKAYSLGGTL